MLYLTQCSNVESDEFEDLSRARFVYGLYAELDENCECESKLGYMYSEDIDICLGEF